jgi:hypothetical protein
MFKKIGWGLIGKPKQIAVYSNKKVCIIDGPLTWMEKQCLKMRGEEYEKIYGEKQEKESRVDSKI